MDKLKLAAAAALIAVAAVLGAVAVTRTVTLGAHQARAADATVRARARQLNAFERSLRHELARKPPPLPAVPKAPVAPAVPAQAPRVVYQRPAPIVIVRHTHHADDGAEGPDSEGGGGD
jgi:hypothetical protein